MLLFGKKKTCLRKEFSIKLRKIGALLIVIVCVVVLVFSYITWKDKLASASEKPVDSSPSIVEKEKKEEVKDSSKEIISAKELEPLIANMDESVQEVFLNRQETGEKVQLLVVGSEAMESGKPGYVERLRETLEETYQGFIEVETVSFDGTSTEFLDEDIDLSAGFDIALMEPFTLNNNGLVEIEVEHEDVQTFDSRLKSEVSDAVLMLQPPQPIYGAGFYLTQVDALEEFATANEFVYINHWSAWPDTTDPALQDYLTEEMNPNNNGTTTWANELTSYFIAE